MEPTALLFRSDRFDLSWPKEVEPKEGDPWGKDCASFLGERLPKAGVHVPDPEPYWGEGGWYLDVEVQGARFNLFVLWWPVGKPPKDYWTIQIRERRGLGRWLLRKRAPEEAWASLRHAVDEALSDAATDARWLPASELSSL